jgi:hypothetical protein
MNYVLIEQQVESVITCHCPSIANQGGFLRFAPAISIPNVMDLDQILL